MAETRFEERGEALIVTPLAPRLDAERAPEFRAEVAERVADRKLVILSLESVRFVDSSGLAGIISVMKRLPPGGQLRLASVNDTVRKLLALTRLDAILPVFDSTEAALAR